MVPFHAVFFSILKHAYRYDASNIVREEQRIQLMRELVDRYRIDVEDEGEFISSILSEISMVKGEMMSLEHYYSKNCSEEIFKKLYEGYNRGLESKGLLDFDDMLVMCYQLFDQRKDILAAWQRRYRFILIDEFQDINRVQYEIVKMLAAPENNLFIVGDDDQSIYRFRGAKPEIMLGFEKDYPTAKRTLLGINYRSSSSIVDAAGRLIRHNKMRFDKEIQAFRGAGRPCGCYGLCGCPYRNQNDCGGNSGLCADGISSVGYCSALPDQHGAAAFNGADDGMEPSLPDEGFSSQPV